MHEESQRLVAHHGSSASIQVLQSDGVSLVQSFGEDARERCPCSSKLTFSLSVALREASTSVVRRLPKRESSKVSAAAESITLERLQSAVLDPVPGKVSCEEQSQVRVSKEVSGGGRSEPQKGCAVSPPRR